MSHETDIPNEAEDLIDWLIGLQKIANEILDADRKVSHVKEALAALSVASLIDQQFYIDCVLVFAKVPDAPPADRTKYPTGMPFTGRLIGLSYLLDYLVPIDSLTVNFEEPSVVDPDLARRDEFRACTFQVPVLAIDSHISLGRAA